MASQIIDDLTHIPNIIGGLGLGVAEAQRLFDLSYVQSIERLMVMAHSFLGGTKTDASGNATELAAAEKDKVDQFSTVIKEFLMAFAPTRYQFTETTLTVKLDMAQHLDVSANLGVGGSIGAVAVNASLAIGYGSDYRGAAEVRTVLQAVPPDPTTLRTMLDRARELSAKELTLPDRSSVDKQVEASAGSLFQKLVGFQGAPVGTSSNTSSTTPQTTTPATTTNS